MAERWLKRRLPRFLSLKFWISWMWSEMGFSKSWSSICTWRGRTGRGDSVRKQLMEQHSAWKDRRSLPAPPTSPQCFPLEPPGLSFSSSPFFPPHRSIPPNIPRFTGRSLSPCKGIWLLRCLHFTEPTRCAWSQRLICKVLSQLFCSALNLLLWDMFLVIVISLRGLKKLLCDCYIFQLRLLQVDYREIYFSFTAWIQSSYKTTHAHTLQSSWSFWGWFWGFWEWTWILNWWEHESASQRLQKKKILWILFILPHSEDRGINCMCWERENNIDKEENLVDMFKKNYWQWNIKCNL